MNLIKVRCSTFAKIFRIFYFANKRLIQYRLIIVAFIFGICMSQIYTFRSEIILYMKFGKYNDFEPIVIKYNESIEDRSMADKLYNDVKILCWVMTYPKNYQKKAKHIKNTWGKRCNKLLLMSSETNDELEIIGLPVGEGRKQLWNKTKEAFKYIYNNYLNEYDWFLKADDDTYVVVENLRYMLYPYDSNIGMYFGCKLQPAKQIYMSGGAGYVLSKEAVKRFVEYGIKYPEYCHYNHSGVEDAKMGLCMRNLGIIFGNSTDSNRHSRFFPLMPEFHLAPYVKDNNFWYWKFIKYNWRLDCCSDYTISFHYISPRDLYVLDYLIYYLKPFGIQKIEQLPKKVTSLRNTTEFKKLHNLADVA